MLGVATVLALLDGQPSGRDRWVMLGLAALMAAWNLAFERLRIPRESPVPVLVYWAGLVVIWFFLAGLDPTYFSLLLALYPQIFRLVRLPAALLGAVALTVVVVWREVLLSGRPLSENPGAVGGGLLSLLFGTLFTIWITRIIDQSAGRRELIEQLEATRGELAAAERESGRLAERQRLARDIHDTLAQGFVSIVLQLQAAEGPRRAARHARRRGRLRGGRRGHRGRRGGDAHRAGASRRGADGSPDAEGRRGDRHRRDHRALPRDAGAGTHPLVVATRLVHRMRVRAEEALTGREIEVLELVARGSSNADVAARLFISEATVKTHLLHIFGKLGVDDRTAAVVSAMERGIIALPRRKA